MRRPRKAAAWRVVALAMAMAGIGSTARAQSCWATGSSPPSGPLPPGIAGQYYQVDYWITVSPTSCVFIDWFDWGIPAGLTLDWTSYTSAVLHGTLAEPPGTSQVSVRAVVYCDCSGFDTFSKLFQNTLSISCGQVQIQPASLPDAVFGQYYSQLLTASGGVAPYDYSITSGALPPGLALSGATISGVATQSGTFSFTLAATDASGCTGSQPYTISIPCTGTSLFVSPRALPAGALRVRYALTFRASGGTPPYAFAIASGPVPPGMTLASSGLLSGSPVSVGSFPFRVRASDKSPTVCAGDADVVLDVESAPRVVAGRGHGEPNPNQAKVLSTTGQELAAFDAYAAGHWGTNVATARLTDAALAQIVTGPGPGAVFGPHVRAFGSTGTPLAKVNYFAYGTLRYGVNVAGGDIDGDAYEEMVTGAGPGAVFGPHVRAFDHDSKAVKPVPGASFFAFAGTNYGVEVTAGDLDGDGRPDLAAAPGAGPTNGPRVRGFRYGTTIAPLPGLDFVAFASTQYGATLSAGELDGDARDEVACAMGPGPSLSSQVRGYAYDVGVQLMPGYDGVPFPTLYGARVGAAQADGAGPEELLVGAGPDPAATARLKELSYTGSGLDLLPRFIFPFPGGYGVVPASGIVQ